MKRLSLILLLLVPAIVCAQSKATDPIYSAGNPVSCANNRVYINRATGATFVHRSGDAAGVCFQVNSGGATINSTNGVLPYRSNSTTFADSPLARTSSTVVTLTGNLVPEAGLTRDLGSSAAKWASVYTIRVDPGSSALSLYHPAGDDVRIQPASGNALLRFYTSGVAGQSTLQNQGDGILMLSNNALNSFGRLQFGGTTSSFPALKRSSAELQVRLADDSDYADLAVENLIVNGTCTGCGSGGGGVDTANSPNANEFARFTDADTIEGRTASETRSDLGLVIGTNVQAYDADLTTYAGITPSANVQTLLGSADFAAFKTSLSLNSVENTALSTWAGTSNITTLGTVGTGTWNATNIALGKGGTGAALTDPNADRIMFWDDSASSVAFLTLGTGLSITGTTISATASGITGADTLVVFMDGTDTPSVDAGMSYNKTTNSLSLTGGLAVGVGGSDAGTLELEEGTAVSLTANTVQHGSIADAPAGGSRYEWGATPATGFLKVTNTSGVMPVTHVAATGVGATVATSTGTQTSGDLVSIDGNGDHVASGFQIGQTPINSQSTAYTLVIGDRGKTILHPTADNNARTFTIPANGSVAFPVGTVITIVNQINTVTISITTDTLVLAGAGSTGSRTLAANGIATIIKVSSTVWIINGTGVS